MRQLYVASDLHGNNNLMGIIDREGKRIFKKKLPNDPLLINDILKPFKECQENRPDNHIKGTA